MNKFSLVVMLLAATLSVAQAPIPIHQPKLTFQRSNTTQLLIAVSPVNSQVVWAAGTGGTFVMTTNGGNTWTSGIVPGAEQLQFRDVQGVSDQVAYLMSIGNNTTDFRIYKTTDGGNTWSIEFTNETTNAFYDCMAFWTADNGVAHSDSVNGVFPAIRTTDGLTWQSIASNMPPALPGEASFSSSGTCITTQGSTNAWITTGGSVISRILATTDGGNTWNAYNTPLTSSPSAGGFSVAFRDALHGVVGGGDLSKNFYGQMAASSDGGQFWTMTNSPPIPGAIFCLAYANGQTLPATASDEEIVRPVSNAFARTVVVTSEMAPNFSTGSAAWTPDEGKTWHTLSQVSGYWAVAFADPQDGWFVGNNGQILKISF
ncbi:MAG: hypothetical protein WAN03_16450 [Candidatus Sulfotelmatobacter sp.]